MISYLKSYNSDSSMLKLLIKKRLTWLFTHSSHDLIELLQSYFQKEKIENIKRGRIHTQIYQIRLPNEWNIKIKLIFFLLNRLLRNIVIGNPLPVPDPRPDILVHKCRYSVHNPSILSLDSSILVPRTPEEVSFSPVLLNR